jgi:xylulose-5-phosphate/fructose-6-phosphate phosphoketolase
MVLQTQSESVRASHGLEGLDFDELFTADKPVIFAFHGYPAMIHLPPANHNIHVRLQGGGHHDDPPSIWLC